MISRQSSLLARIASKWNMRFPLWAHGEESEIARMQWSKVDSVRWWTFRFLNNSSHSGVAKALSRRREILWLPSFMLLQVKLGPQYPKSWKQQLFTTWRNPSIWCWDRWAPPTFSFIERISLKSPQQNQDKQYWLLRKETSFQDSSLRWVSGCP